MQNVKLLSLFIGTFLILNFKFYIPSALAQACPGDQVSCAGSCVAPNSAQGSACTATDGSGRIGTVNECGVCANLACLGGQTLCGTPGVCTPNATTCPMGSNRAYNACTGCNGCSTGFEDCNLDPLVFNCQASTSATCPTPRVYDPCASPPTCTDPYIIVNPGAPQTGFFNITGNGTLGGNVFLTSSRAIQVNTPGRADLNIGNWTVGPAQEFHLALYAERNGLVDLLFRQGPVPPATAAIDRWSLSVRPEDSTTPAVELGDLEIRQGVANWPRVLAIDYATGNVTIDTNLTIGTGAQLRAPEVCVGPGADAIACRTSWPTGGIATSGTAAAPALARFTGGVEGTPLTLTNSLISETVSAVAVNGTLTIGTGGPVLTGSATGLSVGGNITGTGCFGRTYAGSTDPTTYTGSLNGAVANGYRNANALCGAGRHICTTDEIINSIRCGVNLPATGSFWIIEGPPGFTSAVNDCRGWTSVVGDDRGAYWDFAQGSGGVGWLTVCSSELRFACCS